MVKHTFHDQNCKVKNSINRSEMFKYKSIIKINSNTYLNYINNLKLALSDFK